MTREELLSYLDTVESQRAVNHLADALAQAKLVRVPEPVAGGGGPTLKSHVGTAAQWDDSKAGIAFDFYIKSLQRDLTISFYSAYAFLFLIVAFAALIALIVFELVLGRFSAKQLAGVPLAALIGFLFKAYSHERKSQPALRRDLLRAREIFVGERRSHRVESGR